jgi:hypothetical protein
MSQKDYQLIADVLASSYARQNGNTTKLANIKREEIRDMAFRFSAALRTTNPRFDSDRFIDACKVES